MNPITIIFSLMAGLFLAFSIKIISLTMIGEYFLLHQPWWVYLVMGGIVLSGFMSMIHWIEEKYISKDSQKLLFLGALFSENPISRRKQRLL
ncbi:sporulation YhaL family protein [Salipaludibacillus daqingensis]|uniref:sporulation YhaL family protein n=1 Tax=Salipaludibacillus daqingensis TaxID=3041001 RepID=UPI0024735EF7|nr:sporulation YhaL family protein [Salipaludibacillus daqingensis]